MNRTIDGDIVYIAELDQDVDDVIAAEYLYKKKALRCVVLDPIPKERVGIDRKNELIKMGILVTSRIPEDTKRIFIGGALTKVAGFIKDHKLEYLIMNGGFVGNNLVKEPLDKFKNKKECRTFNFNCDVYATDKVFKSSNIDHIMLIGKNVCHDRRNTPAGIWKSERELFLKYHVNDTKLQHDMLACHEGLIELGYIDDKSYLTYWEVQPYNLGLDGSHTLWGSQLPSDTCVYRTVKAAVGWK